MSDKPLVSVIIPNYNYAKTLRLTLGSVRAQTYPSLEVIVVDDGSTDDSVAVAESFGVTVLRTPSNGGCAAARNLGVQKSKGEILFFLDSDVALEPDAVEQAVAILASDSTIGAACGIYDPDPLIRDSRTEEYRSLQYYFWSASSEGNVSFLFPAMCAIPRWVFDTIGPFKTQLKQTEEVDYGYRISSRYQLRLTHAIRGRHDHDHAFRPLLRKLFHRARLRVPLYARARKFAKGFETASRAWGSLAALGAAVTLVPALLLGPLWLAVPLALAIASLACDAQMYGFVRRRKGLAFLLYFVGTHFVVNTVIAAGVGVGVLQWLRSAAFRRLYDSLPGPAPTEVTA